MLPVFQQGGFGRVIRGATGAAPIAPNAITGLKLWLDAQTDVYRRGNAAQFTSANSEYLSHTSNSDLQTGDISFTFCGWLYLDANSSSRAFVNKDAVGAREYQFTYISGTGFIIEVFTAGSVAKTLTLATTPTTGTWYFYVFWHDAAADTLNLQLNNGSTTSVATGTLQAATATEFRLGASSYSGFTSYYSGRMQNVGFWKRVLNSTERSSLWNSGFGKPYAELTSGEKTSMVSWWSLDEASGSRADSHGSNTLTDNNTVTQAAGKVYSGSAAGNGDSVGIWKDQSGQGSHAYNGVAPTYATSVAGLSGKNALDFASQYLASFESAARKPMTIAFVIRPDAVGGGTARAAIGSSVAGGYSITCGASNAQWQAAAAGVGLGASVTTLSAATPYVLVFTYDGSGNYVYRTNGSASASGTDNRTPTASTLAFGAANLSGTNPFDGLIAEVCNYDNVLSAGDIAGLEAYLAQKYGITI